MTPLEMTSACAGSSLADPFFVSSEVLEDSATDRWRRRQTADCLFDYCARIAPIDPTVRVPVIEEREDLSARDGAGTM